VRNKSVFFPLISLALLIPACAMLMSCGGVSTAATSGNPNPSGKTTPTITWPQPAPITNPTPLGATQLDASASVSGTFAYNPPAGTVLAAGSHTLSTTFTPTDTRKYNNATASVSIVVNPAPSPNKTTPTITWAQPAAITNPTPLGPAQLDATANVPGTFAYNPPAGTVLDAGTHTLSVTFTPADTNTYNDATASVTITVNSSTTPPPTPGTATRFIYEIASGQQIQAFSFDESTGAVAPVPGSPYTLPNTTTPGFMTADAGGRFLFVSSQPFEECHGCDYGVNELMGYTINQSTGALTAIPGMPMYPSQSGAILLRPDGKFLYAQIDGEYRRYSVDPMTGALTESGTVPVPSASFNGVWQMAGIDPEGRFLYFSAQSLSGGPGEGFIGVDVLDPNSGNATPASGTPTDVGVTFPLPPVVASKAAAYITGEHPSVGQYGLAAMAVSSNGGLTPQPSSPYAVTTTPSGGQWYSMFAAAADPLGRFVFVSGQPSTADSTQIVTFTVQSDGSLHQSAATNGCVTAAIDGTGNYLFNSGQTQPLVFRINSSDGSLSLLDPLPQNSCGASGDIGGQIVAVP
jgi:6-phosphogluconolactonase (cycloisomerase 2 family)